MWILICLLTMVTCQHRSHNKLSLIIFDNNSNNNQETDHSRTKATTRVAEASVIATDEMTTEQVCFLSLPFLCIEFSLYLDNRNNNNNRGRNDNPRREHVEPNRELLKIPLGRNSRIADRKVINNNNNNNNATVPTEEPRVNVRFAGLGAIHQYDEITDTTIQYSEDK